MSLRDNVTSQQLLAVSFAVIMLVSMGGMAFVGGAGAADTGGTYDNVIEDEVPVNETLNIADDRGDVTLVGETSDLDDGDISVDDDGSITLDPSVNADKFSGVALTPERIDTLFQTDADPSSEPADFLDETVSELNIEGDSAYPVIFIELDPQSEFSQIEKDGSVDGEQDFIVIAEKDDLDEFSGYTGDTADEYVALAVDNDDPGSTGAHTEIVSGGASFSGVVDTLVGSDEADLQNKNIDDFRVAAGTFGSGQADVNALQLSNGTDLEAGETVHSEKITLNPGPDEQYFSSISAADDAAEQGDTIVVDRGSYDDAFDDDDGVLQLSTDGVTVEAGERTAAGDSFDTRVGADGTVDNDEDDDEATVNGQITVADGTANITVDGLHVEDDTPAAGGVDLTGAENPTLTNTIVEDINAGGTAVNFAPATVDSTTAGEVSNNAILAASPNDFGDGDTGLNIADDVELNSDVTIEANLLVGFDTQVNGHADLDLDALLTAHAEQFQDERAQAAVPVTERGGDIVDSANNILGPIDDADGQASDGDVIEVYSGTYDHGGDITVATNDIEVVGVGDGDVTVVDGVDLDVDTEVVFEGIDLADDQDLTVEGANPIATVDDVEFLYDADDGTGSGTLTVSTASEVTVQSVTFEDLNGNAVDAIDINTETDSVSVDDVSITDLGGGAGDGVHVGQTSADVAITDVTVTGDGGSVDGITVLEIDNSAENEYNVSGNSLTELGDGTGITLDSDADNDGTPGENGIITLSDNEIRGGDELIGVFYNLPEAEDVTITGNTIIGEDVSGAGASVGIQFEAITGFGGDPFSGGGGEAIPFQDNTISGHARLIEEVDTTSPVITESGYDAILDEANGNEFGTLVVAPDDGTYADAYGETDNLELDGGDGANSYLPGSVSQAVNLAVSSTTVDETELEVQDPTTLETSGVPDTYVDNQVEFTNATDDGADAITVSGETEDVTVESRFLIDDDADVLNNHSVTDLTIEADPGGGVGAIQITSDNAQTTFDNIDVNSTASGIVLNNVGGDVNVLEVTNSDFNVAANGDGIVASGDADDRYGFIIEDNNIRSAGLTSTGVGIDLDTVEKPGKQDPALDVTFSVQGNTIGGFAKQVNPAEGDFADVSDRFETLLTDNTFEQQVLIQNESGATAATNQTLEDNGAAIVYGDIGTAVDESNNVADDGDDDELNGVILDAEGEFDYADTLTLSATGGVGGNADNVTISGGEDVLISGNVDINGLGSNDDVVFTGFDVVADRDTVTTEDIPLQITVENTVETDNPAEAAYTVTELRTAPDDDLETDVVTVSDTGSNSVTIADTTVAHDIEITGDDIADSLSDDDIDFDDTPGDLEDDAAVRDQVRDGNVVALTANVTGVNVIAPGDDGDNELNFTDVSVSDGDGTYQMPNRGGYVLASDNTNSNIVIDGGEINVEGDGITLAEDLADVDTIDVDGVSITASEAVDPLTAEDYTDEDRVGSGDGVNVRDVTDDDATVTVLDSDVRSLTDDGLNITEDDGNGIDYVVDGTTVDSESATGINATLTASTLEIIGDTSVTADANATNVYETAGADALTVQDSRFEGETGLFLGDEVTADTFDDDNALVGNAFIGNASADDASDVYVQDEDIFTGTVDVSLNYLGDDRGPFSEDAAGVYAGGENQDSFIYDPFLVTDDVSEVDDATDTTEFGHDVHLTGGEVTTVGFPAQVEEGLTLRDVFGDDLQGAVYELENGEFTAVDDFDREVQPFDAYVVQNTGNTTPALVAYDSDRNDTSVARNQFEQGLNFVPATEAGTVDDVLFPGGDTDYVEAPFALGGNLYGVDQSAADFAQDPAAAGFGENFRSGAGDTVVHPHAGYLVIVNEESNDGLTVSERITKPATVDTGNVDQRTDQTVPDTTGTFFDVGIDTVDDGGSPVAAASTSFDVTVGVENLGDQDGLQTVEVTELDSSAGVNLDLPQEQVVERTSGEDAQVTFEDVQIDGAQDGDTFTIEVSSEDTSDTFTVVVQA